MDRSKIVEESSKWVEEGIINQSQREKIVSRYEPDDSVLQGRGSKAIAAFGGLLTLIGIIGLVGLYWDQLGSLDQSFILYGGSALFLGSAYYMKERLDYGKLTTSLVFSGLILFVYGLIHSHSVLEPGFSEVHMVLLGSFIAVPVAWFFRSKLSMLIPVFGIAFWLTIGLEEASSIENSPLILLFYGVLLYSVSNLSSRFKELLLWAGAFFVFTVLFFFTIDITGLTDFEFTLVLGFLAGLASFFGLDAVYRSYKEDTKYDSAWILAALLTGFYLLGLTGSGLVGDYETLFWGVHVAISLGLIIGIGVAAYQRRQKGLLNIGILFFVINLAYLYLDMVFDALGFIALIIGGAVLLAGSIILERERRELVEDWDL